MTEFLGKSVYYFQNWCFYRKAMFNVIWCIVRKYDLCYLRVCKGWVTYRFSYAVRHNDANNMTPPPNYYMRHLQIFDKIDSFLKNVSNVLDNKKVRLHLGRTAYTTCNCWLAFFLFRCRFQEKIEPSSRNCLIWIADWGGSTIPQIHRIHLLFSYQHLQ